MYIDRLELENFRNYGKQTFEFSSGVNIIYGSNAQGKTNAAEAVFYACTGYSPRATRDKQVIKYGEERARVYARAVSALAGNIGAQIEFYAEGGRKMFLNGAPVAKTGELIGNINAVMFNPQELKLVQQSPEDRRRFMDISLSQINRRYFYALQKYKKILAQRNVLLKNSDKDLVFSTLPVWDEQLASVAAAILFDRNAYVDELRPLCVKAHAEVSCGSEKLEIENENKFYGSVDEIKEQLKNALFERMERDMEAGFTTIGPHRDDLKIKLDGTDLRIYGSQGQQRTAALSLKLAEVEIFKKRFGEAPVLILDDAMSELDRNRRERLLDFLKGIQTIVTCTDADEELLAFADKVFCVKKGEIEKSLQKNEIAAENNN